MHRKRIKQYGDIDNERMEKRDREKACKREKKRVENLRERSTS